MRAFIESQFGYCLYILIFHSRSLDNKINRIHKIALKIIYDDKSSSFQISLVRIILSEYTIEILYFLQLKHIHFYKVFPHLF